MMSNQKYTDQAFTENIDKFLKHPAVIEGTFDDLLKSNKFPFYKYFLKLII